MSSTLYSFIWNDFCDKYIELSKFNQSKTTKSVLLKVLTDIIKMMHPFMPYVTEEIYEKLPIKDKESIMISEYPIYNKKEIFIKETEEVNNILEFISNFRNKLSELNIGSDYKVISKINDKEKEKLILNILKLNNKLITKSNNTLVKVEYNKFDLETDGTVTQLNSLEYEFEVIGKYEMKDIGRNKFLDETYLMYPLFIPNNLFSQIKNEIETTDLNKNLNYENNTFIYLNALFKLDSVDSIEDFRNDYLRLFNDSDHYEAITTGDEYYYDIKGSLDNMSMISSVTMFIAGVTSIFIGTLIIYLYLKDRTKEIGILISMGEYKKKIIIQLVCEVAILGLIGLSLSLIASSILGNVIMDYGLNIPSAIIEDYSVNIDIIYIFCMYGIGAVVIIISSIIPVWHLLKSRPKDILL